MDAILDFILQESSTLTPEVMIRFFFVVLIVREIFAILHDLIDFSRRF